MQKVTIYPALVFLIVPVVPSSSQDLFGFHTDYAVVGGKM